MLSFAVVLLWNDIPIVCLTLHVSIVLMPLKYTSQSQLQHSNPTTTWRLLKFSIYNRKFTTWRKKNPDTYEVKHKLLCYVVFTLGCGCILRPEKGHFVPKWLSDISHDDTAEPMKDITKRPLTFLKYMSFSCWHHTVVVSTPASYLAT